MGVPHVAEISDARARMRVLAIDDDHLTARAIGQALAPHGVIFRHVDDPQDGIAEARARADLDVILLDVSMPSMSGLDVLASLRDLANSPAIVMLSADPRAETAVACLRAGAFHYLTKPIRPAELLAVLESARAHTTLRRRTRDLEAEIARSAMAPLLVGSSAAVRHVRAAIVRLARNDVSILIQGESGTGKEVAARALHELGARRERPFVAINCGAIPEGLIDSELFGHARGAFTGALEARPGVFEQADGGTLLLDEIGDMPLHVQARLLRVLQEREVRPIGGDKPRPVDVRVLAATHVDMQRAVRERRFREDLFYRFNVVTLAMPPLRDRTEDIPALVAHFVRKHGARAAPELTPAALDAMMGYDWPGNVRELENAVLQIIALHGGDRVDVAELPARVREAAARPGARGGDDELTIAEARNRVVARFERDYLERLMTRAGGNISEASRQAGLDRANLRRLLRRHRIDPLRYRGERQPSQGS